MDAPNKGARLSDLGECLLLRRALQEDHGVVAENASQDLDVVLIQNIAGDGEFAHHDHSNGKQNPPAAVLSVSFPKVETGYAQQGGIPMDRLHHRLCHFGSS
jgi:hypothetical protein